MTDPARETEAPAGRLAWTAAALIALSAIGRAGVTWTPFPHWDGDPFTQGGPLVALGPAAMLVLDFAACLGAALALAAVPRVSRVGVALFLAGSVGVMIHVAASLEHASAGSAWVAALATGLGAWHLGQIAPIRRALTGVAFGFVAMLVAKGALQFFVEHPQTVAHFRETRDAFYESHGWEPGSRSALVYERRLMQPAASGWFGLANVYATFMAGALATLAIAGLRALRSPNTRNAAFVLLLGALGSAAALAMTGSKGAWAAAGLGFVIGLVPLTKVRVWSRALPWMLCAIPLAVIAAVLVRGALGERLGELSVLFRSFYTEGAARIFGDHPLLGVGPGGFKDAYVLVRPALSPEEVTSSHAAVIDWAATLGVFGFAWGALLLLWAWHAGREPSAPTGIEEPPRISAQSERAARVFTLGVAVAVVAAAGLVERAAITPESAAMRAGGLVAWLALAWAIVRTSDHAGAFARAACAGGAASLLAHTQLDMAAIAETSAPLVLLWLATLACPRERPGGDDAGRAVAAAAPLLAGLVVAGFAFPGIARWERGLREAAEPATVISNAGFDLQSARTPAEARVILDAAAAELGTTLTDADSVNSAYANLVTTAQVQAEAGLARALDARPHHYGTRTALTRVLLQRAAGPVAQADLRSILDRAVAVAEGGPESIPGSASAWMWAGTVHAGLAERPEITDDQRAEHLNRARRFWEGAAALDPRGPSAPARLMALCDRLGDADAARAWAIRSLQADANMRLDPLKQLTPAERSLAERLTSGP